MKMLLVNQSHNTGNYYFLIFINNDFFKAFIVVVMADVFRNRSIAAAVLQSFDAK